MVRTGSAAEPIALVGMSCRLPQAENPAAFWQLLHDGVDALTETADRWPATAAERRRAGFLAEVADFDAGFFGISPTEAAAIDPQQRLVLELAWEALEHAGIVPAALRDTPAGIFVGAIAHDYAKLADRLGAAAGPHSYTGTHRALIANRVSYFLRLTGPSLTVDTGQSSSLVAVQLACESLRRGESRLALAGGVNLNLLGETTETIDRFGALSPDGRCYTFDERANGYARGEGAALVVLKRLSDAIADGDRIRCVLLGGAVNNDGGGAGLTAPSRQAQQQVIERACAQAGLRPADLDYVELHGTGTPVGDPIEAAALGAALGGDRGPDRPLLVGSVKTNIGHLEGAAGIAGLVKVALSLTRRELPASLNFHTAPAAIPLAELGLDVVRQTREWPGSDRPLVAGVSSFGMGGTNCHLVLAEYAEPAASPAVDQPVELPWLLSARSPAALRAQADQLRQLSRAARRGGAGARRHPGSAGAPRGDPGRRPGSRPGGVGRRSAARIAGHRRGAARPYRADLPGPGLAVAGDGPRAAGLPRRSSPTGSRRAPRRSHRSWTSPCSTCCAACRARPTSTGSTCCSPRCGQSWSAWPNSGPASAYGPTW